MINCCKKRLMIDKFNKNNADIDNYKADSGIEKF